MSSSGIEPGVRGGPPGDSAERVCRTIAGEENLTVREERRTALWADDRGEGCGDVGLVGVAGRAVLPPDICALGNNARMRVRASCKLRSSE